MTTVRRRKSDGGDFKPPYPRKRVWGGLVPGVLHYEGLTADGPYSGDLTYPNTLVRGTTIHMDDVVTPGFKTFIAQGRIVNNPYSKTAVDLRNKSGTVRIDGVGYLAGHFAEYTGDYIAILSQKGPFKIDLSEADYSKVSACLYNAAVSAKANIAPPSALTMVTLAEFPKTIELVAEQVARLATAVSMMKKGRPAKAILAVLGKNTSKGVARIPKGKRLGAAKDIFLQRWLETRYGWAPLVYDVQGHLAAYEKLHDDVSPRLTARGRHTQTWTTESEIVYPSSGGPTEPWTFQKKIQWEVVCRAYVLYTQDLKFESLNAFGFTQMPLSLWELVPLSFVVDWFLRVGDWLQAVTPKAGVSILAEGSTISIKADGIRRLESETPNANWVSSGLIGWTDEAQLEHKRRNVGIPSLFYPPVDIKLNPKRLMDALGLLVGAAQSHNRI